MLERRGLEGILHYKGGRPIASRIIKRRSLWIELNCAFWDRDPLSNRSLHQDMHTYIIVPSWHLRRKPIPRPFHSRSNVVEELMARVCQILFCTNLHPPSELPTSFCYSYSSFPTLSTKEKQSRSIRKIKSYFTIARTSHVRRHSSSITWLIIDFGIIFPSDPPKHIELSSNCSSRHTLSLSWYPIYRKPILAILPSIGLRKLKI